MKRPQSRDQHPVPGLRPKLPVGNGGPPPWVDWIHKLGPILSAVVTIVALWLGWVYTVQPVYKRALLEESNARLELQFQDAERKLFAKKVEVTDALRTLSMQKAQSEDLKGRLLIELKNSETAIRQRIESERALALTNSKRAEAEIALRTAGAKLGSLEAEVAVSEKSAEELRSMVLQQAVFRITGDKFPPCARLASGMWELNQGDHIGSCIDRLLTASKDILQILPVTEQKRLASIAIEIDQANSAAIGKLDEALTKSRSEALDLQREQEKLLTPTASKSTAAEFAAWQNSTSIFYRKRDENSSRRFEMAQKILALNESMIREFEARALGKR